jgi:hypothetical protein
MKNTADEAVEDDGPEPRVFTSLVMSHLKRAAARLRYSSDKLTLYDDVWDDFDVEVIDETVTAVEKALDEVKDKVLALILREVRKRAAQEQKNTRRREAHRVERLDPVVREKEVARRREARRAARDRPLSENS